MKKWLTLIALTTLISLPLSASPPRCEGLFAFDWTPSTLVSKNKFVTSRELWEYTAYLHKGFETKLKSLTSDQHWIDLGAGKANAQLDFLKTFSNELDAPLATAVAFKVDRWFPVRKFKGRLQIREGMFEAQPTHKWPKADLITDFFGVLSYSKDMHTSLQKTLDLLVVGGELYIHGTYANTRIRVGEESLGLLEFLSRIEGLQVEGKWGTVRVTKLQQDVLVPRLQLLRYKDDAPPMRSFEVQ